MAIQLISSTNSQEVAIGPFLDDTDGKTAETGLTIANTDIKIWKSGATSLVNKNSGGATHMANGVYSIVLDATDTGTSGPMVIFCHVAGALPVRVECFVEYAPQYHVWRNYVWSLAMAQATGTPTTTTVPITMLYPTAAASSNDNEYVGLIVYKLATGPGFTAGAVARVSAYNGTTKTLTVEPPFPSAPSNGDLLMLLPGAPGVLTDGAITAAKIATDAIDADAIKADAVTEIQSGLATAAAVSTLTGYVDTEVAAILADTNELQTDWVNGGRLDLLIDAIKAKSDTLPASPAAVGSAMTLATGAITAAVIATGAIDADALAARSAGGRDGR